MWEQFASKICEGCETAPVVPSSPPWNLKLFLGVIFLSFSKNFLKAYIFSIFLGDADMF